MNIFYDYNSSVTGQVDEDQSQNGLHFLEIVVHALEFQGWSRVAVVVWGRQLHMFVCQRASVIRVFENVCFNRLSGGRIKWGSPPSIHDTVRLAVDVPAQCQQDGCLGGPSL